MTSDDKQTLMKDQPDWCISWYDIVITKYIGKKKPYLLSILNLRQRIYQKTTSQVSFLLKSVY